MFNEKIPQDLHIEPVSVLDSSGKEFPGEAATKTWTSKEAFWRGFKKSLKIVSVIILAILPFGFLEPFLFMVWGSISIALILLVIGPFLHFFYWSEPKSFYFVDANCPYCHMEVKLTPYLSTAFKEKFSALCPNCGQTMTILSKN